MMAFSSIVGAPFFLCCTLFLSLALGCSAFAPSAPSSPPCVCAPTAPQLQVRRTVLVFSRANQDTVNNISIVSLSANATPTVGDKELTFSQKFLAEQEASGRVLTKYGHKWWKRFGELEEYKREHGDCNVPRGYKENPQLANWVMKQRTEYRSNKLSSERIETLERIGFEWIGPKGGGKPDDASWWKRFHELEEYKREHGHCNVPQRYKENPQLANWVKFQRVAYNRNKMSSERVEALERIGFEWTGPKGGGGKRDDASWWRRLNELEEYKGEHGDCNVPINYEANLPLAKWVMNQRAAYARFKEGNPTRSPGISTDRIETLNSIGFEWRLRERPEWDKRYDELLSYKETHGDTLVPMDMRKDSANKHRHLAMWVLTQRTQYRLLQEGEPSHLTDDRIEKLDSIGFVWSAQEEIWDSRLNELKEFKATHGHTDVPKSWKNEFLFRWVSSQRTHHKAFQRGKATLITEERIKQLEAIGFEWKSKNTYKWKIGFGELRDFYNRYGIGPIPSSKMTLYRWATKQKKEYEKYIRGEKTNMDEERIKDLESVGFFDIYGK